MQIKTIEKVIINKMNEWLETITDEDLRKETKNNLLVSGGSIASMLMGADVNDYDVYIKDINVLKKLTNYYIKPFENEGVWIADGREKKELLKKYCIEEEQISSNNYHSIALRNLKEDQIKLMFESKEGGIRLNEEKSKDELNYDPVFFSPNAISLSNDLQIVLRFWGDNKKIHETFDFVHATNYFTFETGLVTNIAANGRQYEMVAL